MKETKELMVFLISLTNTLADVLKDKKVTFAEAFKFLPSLLKIQPAFDGIDKIKDEIMNMGPEGANELQVLIEDQLEVNSEKAKLIAQHAISMGLTVVEMLRLIQEEKEA